MPTSYETIKLGTLVLQNKPQGKRHFLVRTQLTGELFCAAAAKPTVVAIINPQPSWMSKVTTLVS